MTPIFCPENLKKEHVLNWDFYEKRATGVTYDDKWRKLFTRSDIRRFYRTPWVSFISKKLGYTNSYHH